MLQKEIEIDEKPILPYGVTTFEKVETTKQSMIKRSNQKIPMMTPAMIEKSQ